MFVPDYRPEYIFSYTAQVRLPPEVIGPTPDGIRVNFYVTGGEVDGPKLKGKLAPVGGEAKLKSGVRFGDRRARMSKLDGKVAIVTGAARGLGRGCGEPHQGVEEPSRRRPHILS
jgi:Protein of unknown function (DUF3237)